MVQEKGHDGEEERREDPGIRFANVEEAEQSTHSGKKCTKDCVWGISSTLGTLTRSAEELCVEVEVQEADVESKNTEQQ
jgi:hypothetical protein